MNLFEVQHPSCRQPLPPKDFLSIGPQQKRILQFDPGELYNRIHQLIDPYSRVQANIGAQQLFPDLPGQLCACGCGQPITGRRTRYATDSCRWFVSHVTAIIRGQSDIIGAHVRKYFSPHVNCIRCFEPNETFIDHIIPVKHGGGGCWLSNFQILCHSCHREKTCQDFGWLRNQKF